jgi:type II restriction/modification system DNA methylase subunit YeeA
MGQTLRVLRPPEKGGKFEISEDEALVMLKHPNPNGFPSSDVMVLWKNAKSLTQSRESKWIIDFPPELSLAEAACYEGPFSYLLNHVKDFRSQNRYEGLRERWWVHRRPGLELRSYQRNHTRTLCTPMVSKHRSFLWIPSVVQPDKTAYCFGTEDDYFFGVLHSRPHEVWARAQGTQVRERESGFRYTPTTCFETFPFPEPTEAQRAAIAEAARRLNELRENWLNPAEWVKTETLEFPASVDGPWARYVVEPDARGIGTARWPRLVPRSRDAATLLKKRTLTNLYNSRPAWLDQAHQALDAAVFAAYGWPSTLSDDALLAALLDMNLTRPAAGPAPCPEPADDPAE